MPATPSATPLAMLSVSTVAGGRDASLVDGFGTDATFIGPNGMVYNSRSGAWYVADYYNRVIRMLDVTTGEVTTVAGGTSGFTNDIGSNAQFGRISGLAFDPTDGSAGMLYAVDVGNHAIRGIDVSNYDVSTLAGTGAPGFVDTLGTVAAKFTNPYGAIFDGAGNLFVTDQGNNAIRKIHISSATVTTLVGGSSGAGDGTGTNAQFNVPCHLAFDGPGRMLVTDALNNKIRAVDMTTLAVTTIAGGVQGSADGIGTNAQFYYPSGIAVDVKGNVLITEVYGSRLRIMNNVTYNVVLLAGSDIDESGLVEGVGTIARFTHPAGVSVDNEGIAYVVDTDNNAIRRTRYL